MMSSNLFSGSMRVTGRARTLALLLAVTVASLIGLLLVTSEPAHAADTFTVDRSDDPDLDTTPTAGGCTTATANDCSLRGAINAANNTSGADTINFNIPGSGVKTIQVDGDDTTQAIDLPVITEAVTIDGYSQPGASPNSPENELLADGTDAKLLIELNGALSRRLTG